MFTDHLNPPTVEHLEAIAERIGMLTGLHFAGNRLSDLASGLANANNTLCFETEAHYSDWLLTHAFSPQELALLAMHLTVGETYFNRERDTLDAVERHILPSLFKAEVGLRRSISIWSAGCSTGEEPYTLAMMLLRNIVALDAWTLSIMGTDINSSALEKARAGCYRAWSFRQSDEAFRKTFFREDGQGNYQLTEAVRDMVQFQMHNLARDEPPGVFDLILCRNVFIYFAPHTIRRVLERIDGCLAPNGFFLTSVTETRIVEQSELFTSQTLGGVTLFMKKTARDRQRNRNLAGSPTGLPPRCVPVRRDIALGPERLTNAWNAVDKPRLQGDGSEARDSGRGKDPAPIQDGGGAGGVATGSGAEETALQQARKHADAGEMDLALECCRASIEANLQPEESFLLIAAIQQEKGDAAAMRSALRGVLYLDPDNIVALVRLGMLGGDQATKRGHQRLRRALDLLDGRDPAEPVPHGDGLTCGQMRTMILSATGGDPLMEVKS